MGKTFANFCWLWGVVPFLATDLSQTGTSTDLMLLVSILLVVVCKVHADSNFGLVYLGPLAHVWYRQSAVSIRTRTSLA